ncbi:hypothetical protein KOR42_41340 [Thalassoglobus neptunius]|uniref:Tetratricopeptide repeat protein n=1 Tax=Thalassoglobus neptunius TaxID=1938619 RepID=A0A5C5W8B9_9PLAN|nr:hypothetical protein [Thalassoglobus neptunius]TWT47136.1 hypothetical protein KOR42_41340 [Thalassoglobus neptunius]
MTDDINDIVKQIETQDQKSEEHFQNCQIRTAMRTAKETTRLAKTHQLAIHYMRGLFDQMRFGHGLLDPQATRDVSVELVLLLEDEEAARRIEPSLDQGHYNWVCSWMSSCAYDNLAEATGMMSGYNSPGMHECISEGIQICRQTGKMECVKCFREYASDVYLASEDFAMVRHQCQSLLEYRKGSNDNKDRRWSGHHKLAKVLLLEGRVDRALEELKVALELAGEEDVYLKRRSKLLVQATRDEALLLAGQPRQLRAESSELIPPPGEWPFLELQLAVADSLEALMEGNVSKAIEILTGWDRKLTEQNCLKDWFEVRLRLISAYLISQNEKRASALAKGLEAKAHESQDYLTVSRMAELFDHPESKNPTASLWLESDHQRSQSVDSVTSSEAESQSVQQDDQSENQTDEASASSAESSGESDSAPDDTDTPLSDFISDAMLRLRESEDPAIREQLLEDFLAHDPNEISAPMDAAYLVHLSQFLVQGPDQARRVWQWALGILDEFPDHAKTLSVVATLGHYFRTADPANFNDILPDQLMDWFELSTKLDLNDAQNYARAGRFYAEEGFAGESERCFSRAFRLNRLDASVVIPLADQYRDSDRPRDALAVLDLSLREGADDQSIAWEAAMTSLQLEQFDSMLTYLDRFLELGEAQTWTHYYRAVALLHQGKHEESLKELDFELQHDPPGDFHLDLIRLCNLIALARHGEVNALFEAVLDRKLSEVNYLSANGLSRLMNQLWKTVIDAPDDYPQQQRLEDRLLVAGLIPEDYFDRIRMNTGERTNVQLYRAHVHQPLSESWADSPACLVGQQEWNDYETDWGVLAENEEQAVNLILTYQSKCSDLPAQIVDIESDEQEYLDHPGIVWQGARWSTADLNDLEMDDLPEDEIDE